MRLAAFLTLLLLRLSLAHKDVLRHFGVENIKFQYSEEIVISASPALLNQSGEWVEITYSGVSNPNSDDFIAVYSPSNVSITETAPVKYQFANVSEGYLETGNGTMSFRLVNMFADYVFVFFHNGTSSPTAAIASNTVEFTNYEEPLQPHLALTTFSNTEMKLSWACGKCVEQYVQWGYSSGDYTNIQQSVYTTYTREMLCGGEAKGHGWRDPGNLHNATMTDLKPNTTVYYIFGSNSTGWSDEYSYKTPIPIGPTNGFRLVAYGDMGKGEYDNSIIKFGEQPSLNTTFNVENLIKSGQFDLVLHIGDISYARGYSSQWDEFMFQITPVASRVPYMTLPGNHERDWVDSGSYYNEPNCGGECGIPYETRFSMSNTNHETQWYSFEYGNIHFVMISTEHELKKGSNQYEFISNDLEQVDRSKTPWLIFVGHRPMYVDTSVPEDYTYPTGAYWSAIAIRESLEDLIVKHKVDITLFGHHHSYQRTCPLSNNGTCHETGSEYPVHFVIGMGGCSLSAIETDAPNFIEYVDNSEWGYSTIETTEHSLSLQYFNNDNVLKDQFVLKK